MVIGFLSGSIQGYGEREAPNVFVQSLCQCAKSDAVLLKDHVRFPLAVKRMVSEGGGDPIYKQQRIKTSTALKEILASVCDDFRWKEVTTKETSKGVRVNVPIGQFEAEFLLKKSESDSYLLVSLQV